ncbi:STY4851/ECs_5259 family protein [Hansschlegelia beijingensis]
MQFDVLDFSRLSNAELERLFRQDPKNIDLLGALRAELKKRDDEQAVDLYFTVFNAHRAIQRASGQPSQRSNVTTTTPKPARSSAWGWLQALLAARGLQKPDGRPLYRYRISDAEYDTAKHLIRTLVAGGGLSRESGAGAIFVAYCAEWFRRESNSTFLKWDDPAPDLFSNVHYQTKQRLAEAGLDYWKRPLRKSDTAREFLVTVALEGGVPVRVLRDGSGGWLKDYTRAVMRRAVAWRAEGRNEIDEIAEEERWRMRKSYSHDDFVALCSELAYQLIQLRRIAEAEGTAGVRNTALLDARRPGWRDDLPLYVAAEDEAFASELLGRLIDEKLEGLTTEGVEARRFLVRKDGEWRPALQILADGEIHAAKLPGLSSQARTRAIPAGDLAKFVVGELAILEPPAVEKRRFRLRPLARLTRLLTDFPFSSPASVVLASPAAPPKSWVWPGGGSLRSDVLTFREDEGATPEQPLLRYLGGGSVSSPLKTLWSLVPDGWTVQPIEPQDPAPEIQPVPSAGCKLIRVTRPVYLRGPEADQPRFRIEPDKEGRTEELEITPPIGLGVELADERWEAAASPTRVRICGDGRQARDPAVGELFARAPGAPWKPVGSRLSQVGPLELSWRDAATNVQLDRRRLVLLPPGAKIFGEVTGGAEAIVRREGLDGWHLAIRDPRCESAAASTVEMVVRFVGRPVWRVAATLKPPQGPAFDIVIPIAARDAVIALADGTVVAPGRHLDAGSLRGAVALSPVRKRLSISLKGSRAAGLVVAVEGELPLGVARAAIDEMLATTPSQDDFVELEFVGECGAPIRVSRYREAPLKPEGDLIRRAPSHRLCGVAVARMILDPRHEHALEEIGAGEWRIPDRCSGSCLVYLRDGPEVVSRPIVVDQPRENRAPAGDLQAALLQKDFEARQTAILACLKKIGRDPADGASLRLLLDMAIRLNGLPPSALDALKLAPRAPAALIQILLNAGDASDRGAIWSLQNELPFLWLALPLRAWRHAIAAAAEFQFKTYEEFFGPQKAQFEADAFIYGLRDELLVLEPALQTVFEILGVTGTADQPTLAQLTAAYVTSQHDQPDEPINDLARELTAAGVPIPSEIIGKSHSQLAGLFAPVLLAASTCGLCKLQGEHALLVRRTLRADPGFVTGAWSRLVPQFQKATTL